MAPTPPKGLFFSPPASLVVTPLHELTSSFFTNVEWLRLSWGTGQCITPSRKARSDYTARVRIASMQYITEPTIDPKVYKVRADVSVVYNVGTPEHGWGRLFFACC
jgi:hypothetical protein